MKVEPGQEAPVPHSISAARRRTVVSRDKDYHPSGADCAVGGRSRGCQREEERKVSRPKGGMHRGRVSKTRHSPVTNLRDGIHWVPQLPGNIGLPSAEGCQAKLRKEGSKGVGGGEA
ncbi:unnamed protein product [Pleuronectes platessa]|uniref:Uncharacterized protein n=1 Tax=Pleuronectes platessa TaxID=8262 RepID=A0A9N7YLL9_PLEPL|nr:unnamed protein product [Pleuronectes platessa]